MSWHKILPALALASATLAWAALPAFSAELPAARAIGDTLTVIARPVLSIPQICTSEDSFTIEARASSSASGWTAGIEGPAGQYALSVDAALYDSSLERWFLDVTLPPDVPEEIYDLTVTASGGILDTEAHAVMVRQSISDDFYFVHITDTHLPTHKYYYESGADSDTSEMVDLRAVIDDINIINPAFVLLTGDVVNEGELEDFLNKRYYTRAKRILKELQVPVYISAGNHDIGGWDSTPPPDGTARRNWWKFFGWSYLYDPPLSDRMYTQNYSFDYGGAHFVSLEAYNNYDNWRRSVYGSDSFTSRQLAWFSNDLATVPPSLPIIAFYHMDFQEQLNLGSLGVDCALWGHIHYSSGSTSHPPYDLSLEGVCDGGRAMRLVRVANGSVSPGEPMDAGSSGSKLRQLYEYTNDGTRTENAAGIINNLPEDLDSAIIKFRMDAGSAPYEVDAGDLFQTIVEGDVATCYVRVAAPAYTITPVYITPQQGSGVEEVGARGLSLVRPSFPNPATDAASVAFALSEEAPVRIEIFDVNGRNVRTLQAGVAATGRHEVEWDLRDRRGSPVSSGVYLWRISSGDASILSKCAVLR